MKTLHLLAVLLLISCLGCGKSPEVLSVNEKEVTQQVGLEVKEQSFTVTADQPSSLTTQKGITLSIPSDAFVDNDGNPIMGEVDIVVKDYVDLSEILTENISTLSPEGLLATRGMLDIRAFTDQQEVSLGKDKGIDVIFPGSPERYADAQLYYGFETENGTIEWTAASTGKTTEIAPNEEEQTRLRTLIYPDIRLRGLQANQGFFRQGQATQDSLHLWLDLSEEEIELLVANQVRVYWTLFKDGDFEVYHIRGAIPSQLKQKLTQRLNTIPPIAPYYREGSPADISGRFQFDTTSLVKDIVHEFTLRTYQLGWVNCDIFLRIDEPMISMSVPAPHPEILLKLVFNDYNTVVTGIPSENGMVLFPRVPQGARAKIIAIYPQDGQAQLSITNTQVKEEITALSDFVLVDGNQLVQTLDELLE